MQMGVMPFKLGKKLRHEWSVGKELPFLTVLQAFFFFVRGQK